VATKTDANTIMREERDITLSAINALPVPQHVKGDVLAVCAAAQEALNDSVASLGRPIDPRVGPTALRLIADELERVARRFREAGLMAPLN